MEKLIKAFAILLIMSSCSKVDEQPLQSTPAESDLNSKSTPVSWITDHSSECLSSQGNPIMITVEMDSYSVNNVPSDDWVIYGRMRGTTADWQKYPLSNVSTSYPLSFIFDNMDPIYAVLTSSTISRSKCAEFVLLKDPQGTEPSFYPHINPITQTINFEGHYYYMYDPLNPSETYRLKFDVCDPCS